jgi:hypothetical protein
LKPSSTAHLLDGKNAKFGEIKAPKVRFSASKLTLFLDLF